MGMYPELKHPRFSAECFDFAQHPEPVEGLRAGYIPIPPANEQKFA